jgi:hypothetical protein
VCGQIRRYVKVNWANVKSLLIVTAMLRNVSELGVKGAFSPEEVRILVNAFDAAWEAVKASGAPFSEPNYEETARDILATSIIYAANNGERDERSLTEGALLQLSKANMRRQRPNPL